MCAFFTLFARNVSFTYFYEYLYACAVGYRGGVALVFSGLILELLGKYSRDSTLHGTGAPSAPSRLSTAVARTSSHSSIVYAHDSENRGAGRPDEMAQADPAIATLGSAGGAGDYFLASGMGQLRKRASTRKEF